RRRGGQGGARIPEHLLHHDRLVAPAPAARPRLRDLVAELDHVLGAAAGAQPLRADPPAAASLARIRRAPNYPCLMREAAGDLGRKAIALLVLLVAAWILFKVILGVISVVAWIVVVVVAIAAIVWAIRVL